MNRSQFELSLSQTKSSDWAHFEVLCSKFLASEHPAMRTMASSSGDGGRDSELLSPDGNNYICAQYSVSQDWEGKISRTQKRLREHFPDVKYLIYLSNQEIGAKGDKIKTTLLSEGIFLDIRDKSWFLDRFDSDESRRSGAEEYFERIGRPYLEGLDVVAKKNQPLSAQESKAALTYLSMQWEDEHTDKGLTKLSYEALVRAALRKTDANNRKTRTQIVDAIHSYLPSHDISFISQQVNSALRRLDKNVVKHLVKEDEFHLAFDEQQRLTEKFAQQVTQDSSLDNEICRHIESISSEIDAPTKQLLCNSTKHVLDLALLKSGENFAISVLAGSVQKLDPGVVTALIIEELHTKYGASHNIDKYPKIIEYALEQTIKSQDQSVRKHIKTLSDTYTLFAFLKETTDVQKATKKIFSFGKIWLDTTLVLPLLADRLRQDDSEKRFSLIIKDLITCGVEVFVTTGVVNEILHHMRLSITCATAAQWRGRVPYLYGQYIQDGRDCGRFTDWISQFRGTERPEQDIVDFLSAEYGIKFEDLTSDYENSDEILRHSLDRLWREAHTIRRGNNGNGNGNGNDNDSETLDILIRNDVVSYIGIIEKRKRESSSDLGYQHWWLTIDSTAWDIRNSLAREFESPPSSPLMSLDFLIQNMSFGPNKSHLKRSDEQLLPVLLDVDIYHVLPPEILAVAENVRKQYEGQPEYVIRRKVRDACDRARRLGGGNADGMHI